MLRNVKRIIGTIVFIMILLVGVIGNYVPVQAAAEFTIRNSPPTTNNKYYYNSKYNANAGSSTYKMPNCTTYVLGRVYEITGKKFDISGDAGDYFKNNKKYDSSTDPYEPKVGAVVCYSKWDKSKAGHVQIVEKIGTDSKGKYICVSESNYSGRNSGKGSLKFNYMKIYLDDLAKSKTTGETHRTLLEDNDGYSSSKELYQNFVYTKFQGYIYPAEITTDTEQLTLNKTSVNIEIGEVQYIKVTSEIPSGKKVTWTTSNKDIATVTSDGNMAMVVGTIPGTTTVTATCGTMKATCKVTVKGDNNQATIKITDDGVTKIKETSARINASISPGTIIDEAGFYWGTSKSNLKQVKESINAYTTDIWYDLGTGKWTSSLKSDTTYYYQLYVKINGKTYKTSVKSFKTAEGESYTLTNSSVTKLTSTSAKIKATLSPGVKIEKAGFYYGKSSSNMTKKTETINAYAESVYYDLGTGKWTSALSPNTKYYYQLYVVINGTEYKSKLSSFTTAKNKIVEDADIYTSVKSSDITETSAYIRADYTKDKYDDLGFYFGTSQDLASMTKTSEFKHDGSGPTTSYANSYKLGVKYDGYGYKWWNPLEPGTKYYYAFYVVLDGTEYISAVKNFTTKGTATIESVTVTSYPTKKDYVVGEKIDTSGVKLKVTYSNGKTSTITSGISVSGDASKTGTRQITLKYEGYSFKYNINVTQPLTSISLNKTSSTLDVDDVLTLKVTYNPTDTTDSKDVTWKSSNTKVATVSNGMVVAVGGGTATITATCGNKTATCKVTVRVPVSGVSLNKTSAVLTSKGATVTLKATVAPSDAANKNVTWASSDTSVATVSSSGVVKAVGEGITTVSVTTESGNMTAICVITVDYPENNIVDSEKENPDAGQYPEDVPNEDDSQEEEVVNPPQDSEDEIVDSPQTSEKEDDVVDTPQDSESEDDIMDTPQTSESEDDVVDIPQDSENEDESTTEDNFVVEDTEITSEDMEDIVEENTTQRIEITNESGVVFTFEPGSMSSVDGIDKYDFSTEIISNFTNAEKLPFSAEACVLKIKYAHSGELPGPAIVSIPVGTEWTGKQLYYYQIFDDGTYKYTGESAVVDAKGNFTINQRSCAESVISTVAPTGRNEDGSIVSKLPYMLIVLLLLVIAGAGVLFAKKKRG